MKKILFVLLPLFVFSQVKTKKQRMVKVAPRGTAIHTSDFELCAKSEEADKGMLDSAKALAMTVVDCWHDAALLKDAKEFFQS